MPPRSLIATGVTVVALIAVGHAVVGKAERGPSGYASAELAPGVRYGAVTQATIHETICVPGWTATIRPPSAYTTRLKMKQLRALGYGDQNVHHYEEDHVLPLELGGDPTSPRNLYPQPWTGSHNAKVKDVEENRLRRAVCADTMTLAAAQTQMLADWVR